MEQTRNWATDHGRTQGSKLKSYVRTFALTVLVVLSPTSVAHVSETLAYTYYDVNVTHSKSMGRALDLVSRHSENGKIYYGHTTWDVHGDYDSLSKPNGACKISKIEIELKITIDLPNLSGASERQKAIFDKFLAALRTHELGHYAIGREMAAAIDAKVAAIPEMPNCNALDSAIDAAQTETENEFKERNRKYDDETGHGKTQGAFITE